MLCFRPFQEINDYGDIHIYSDVFIDLLLSATHCMDAGAIDTNKSWFEIQKPPCFIKETCGLTALIMLKML